MKNIVMCIVASVPLFLSAVTADKDWVKRTFAPTNAAAVADAAAVTNAQQAAAISDLQGGKQDKLPYATNAIPDSAIVSAATWNAKQDAISDYTTTGAVHSIVSNDVASWAMAGQPQPTTDLGPAFAYTTAVSNKLETGKADASAVYTKTAADGRYLQTSYDWELHPSPLLSWYNDNLNLNGLMTINMGLFVHAPVSATVFTTCGSDWSGYTYDGSYSHNLQAALDAKATSNALAAVAWSGAYGDLSGRPTIPEVPSGIVTTNADGWATDLKIKAGESSAGVWLNNGYFNVGANGMAMIELPMYAGDGASFSGAVNIGDALTVANQIYANGGISAAAAPISATALATINRDDWSGYTYDGDSSHNLQSALDAKVNASSLAAVATSGSYGDLLNKPTIPTDEGITNAATAVFADCADYILTNAATSAAFTIRSGEIAQTAISGTSLDLTLDFSTAANRSGDCLVYAVCAQDATLAILPSASVAPLGTDWTALKAGTNLVCVTRVAYDGGKSVVAVAVKEVK